MTPHDTYQPRWASSGHGLCVSRHPLPSLPVAVGELEGCPGKPAVRRSVAVILTVVGMHVKQRFCKGLCIQLTAVRCRR
jgi:hypothetical protein